MPQDDERNLPKELEDACAELLAQERSRAQSAELNARQLQTDLERTKTDLAVLQKKEFSALAAEFAGAWKTDQRQVPRKSCMVDDPVYLHVALDEATATVLSHPMVQRLNYIKQLSFSYLQFPSATHTRLAHSLGAAKNAELAIQGMLDRGVFYSSQGEEILPQYVVAARPALLKKTKVAGLLHDLGHGPFGHALDKYIGFIDPGNPKPSPDKYYTASYIENFLRPTLEQKEVGLDGAEIAAILRPENRNKLPGMDALIADIVDSPLDADRMDYLTRDAHMTGLSMGFTNTMALIDRMRPFYTGRQFLLTYDISAVPYIEHFLYARDAMFINCYEHFRKLAAERVFTKIVDGLISDESVRISKDDLVALTDEQIMVLLSGIGSGSEVRAKLVNRLISNAEFRQVHVVGLSPLAEEQFVKVAKEELLAMNASEVQDWVAKIRSGPQAGSTLTQAVRDWNEAALQGLQGNPKETYIEKPRIWEELIASKSIGTDRAWQVLVVVPSYEVYLAELSATRILLEEPANCFSIKQFFDVSTVMREVLGNLMVQRRKIRVLCLPDVLPREEEKLRKAAIEVLGQ
jgi:HD superfamily phosphohydrolase